jgi:hypothetical protein
LLLLVALVAEEEEEVRVQVVGEEDDGTER